LAGENEVAKVAVPELSVPVPSEVKPLLNVTVPVGVPVPAEGATVAVRVTIALASGEVGDAVSMVVVVVRPVTERLTAVEVLVA
jgi:hypothetical protein